MKNFFILLILLAMVVSSCGKDKENKKKSEEKKEILADEKPDQIFVTISAKVLVDDVFEIYYYEPGYDGFSSRDFVNSKIKGRDDFQDIKFELPKRIYPERLRFDFGKNKDQKEMILKGIKMSYKDKEYVFPEEDLKKLRPSKFMEFNPELMSLNTKAIDNRYDPYFYSPKLTNIVDYLVEGD